MISIPFSSPDITQAELDAVVEVIKSGWLAHGKYSERLEELFCEFTGAKYATTVSNCTAGLHLSCLAAGLGPGDEVIVPAQTHTATAHAVEYTGAKAVFADVHPITGNILIDEIESKYTPNTRAVIPVHMGGCPCNMEWIQKFCNKHDLVLIEDCAHAIGTQHDGKHVGNFGISGNFSFYPTKQITTGEGGVVITNDSKIIDFIKKQKAFGIDTPPELRTKPGVYDVGSLGYNFRMTDIQAALGAGQMERYKVNLLSRHENAKLYTELFKECDLIEYTEFSYMNSYFIFQIILKEHLCRNEVILKLKEKGIGVSVHYATPVPLMSYYKKKYAHTSEEFPNAVKYANQSIALPVHTKLTKENIQYIVNNIIQLVDEMNNII